MVLDIYQPHSVQAGDDRPVLFYMHGGGWTMGSKRVVGPLLTEMISYDWIVVSVNYRLNSKAGYPTQLMDCKRALRWVKDQIRVFGGNPNNIVAAGDSAGGHMACLLASTTNQPELQPGFEDIDTTIQGVLGLSAVVNLVDPEDYCNHDCRTRFIKEVAKREGSPESEANLRFLAEHSPTFRIKRDGVPYMMIHGDIDTLTPVQHTRDFVNRFRNTCTAPITYLEVPGGHHCFHLISSPRSWYMVIAASQWLNYHFEGTQPKDGKDTQVHEIVEWDWD
ncbi:MAG: Alpha/Beta hydrolase protein [Benniella sp.]|nr:MAG: Alpha/Beta hydrolase protein [Benniella sp.]